MEAHRTVRIILKIDVPVNDPFHKELPWFTTVKINGENYRIANYASLERMRQLAIDMEDGNVEIVVLSQ